MTSMSTRMEAIPDEDGVKPDSRQNSTTQEKGATKFRPTIDTMKLTTSPTDEKPLLEESADLSFINEYKRKGAEARNATNAYIPPLSAPVMKPYETTFTPESTIWDVYNNEARILDNELVKDWTSSLNFLLVFAAIFSAILTSFIIESKNMLQQDSTDVIANVLIFYTNNLANGTHTYYTPPEFKPSNSAISVNCLLFASLSASIIAALASVIALQWVGEYDAAITRSGASPEDRVKRRQYRYGGVVKWKMSEIVAALPILLYCSVGLFFAGVAEWMLNLDAIVGFIVLGGAVISGLFYFASTALSVLFPSSPFRSPLSRWIYYFLHLLTSAFLYALRLIQFIRAVKFVEHSRFSLAKMHLRDNVCIEADQNINTTGLIWLAKQISLSPDSYRRLLLLIREVLSPDLYAQPSKIFNDIPWWNIFDVLGSRYLDRARSGTIGEDDTKELLILVRCLRDPRLGPLMAPSRPYEYPHSDGANPRITATNSIANRRMNAAYFLIQNLDNRIPDPVQIRNRLSYLGQPGLSSKLEISKSRISLEVEVTRRFENRQIGLSEAIRTLYSSFPSGRERQQEFLDFCLLSLSMGFPVARMPPTHPPSHILRHQESLSPVIGQLRTIGWIHKIGEYADISSSLQLLQRLQNVNPDSRPLWRLTATDEEVTDALRMTDQEDAVVLSQMIEAERRDRHQVEALKIFDKLIASKSKEEEIGLFIDTVVKLVCRDLEIANSPLYDGYYTEERNQELYQLRNPCLQVLACAASGMDWPSNWILPKSVPWSDAWKKVSYFCLQQHSLFNESTIWGLLTSLWDHFDAEATCYGVISHALTDVNRLNELERGFQQPKFGINHGGELLLSKFYVASLQRDPRPLLKRKKPRNFLAFIETEAPPTSSERDYSRSCALRLAAIIQEVKGSQTRLADLMKRLVEVMKPREGDRWPEDTTHLFQDFDCVLMLVNKHLLVENRTTSPQDCYNLASTILGFRDALLKVGVRRRGRSTYPIPDANADTYTQGLISKSSDVVHGLLDTRLHAFRRPTFRTISCTRPVVGRNVASGWLGMYED